VVEAEIRELLTHVPVWHGKPGVLTASRRELDRVRFSRVADRGDRRKSLTSCLA
jgi:hypothetical protein